MMQRVNPSQIQILSELLYILVAKTETTSTMPKILMGFSYGSHPTHILKTVAALKISLIGTIAGFI
jgi:hypothetical protein